MSKGSKRREEDSAKIDEMWDKIFKSRWPIEEALEDYKNVCIMDVTVLGHTMISCPCPKCNISTL